MGSPVQRRWPNNAEAARVETIKSAESALQLLQSARDHLRRNPLHSEMDIADAMRMLEQIRRLMNEAKNGID